MLLTYDPVLQIQADLNTVKTRFEELQVLHLPVLQDKQLLGCIRLEDIQNLEEEKTLNDYKHLLHKMSVYQHSNWMDILQEFARHNTDVLPILDSKGEYIGFLEVEDFIHSLEKMPFLSEPGAVLVIETASHHYSASEISQIIESNNGKVMGMFITSLDTHLIECTIKLNSNRINEIVQTFRRYGYEIKSEHIEDSYTEGLKERSKYLNKFLNI